MSTKFFNNSSDNTLFDKFKGIAEGMPNFDAFCAVVGYFRSSGYFKLRKELNNVNHIKILVGINIDNIFRKHNPAYMFFGGDDEQIKRIYTKDFIQDVRDAKYTQEVEEGILQLCEDIASSRLEMRIHKSKNLHAKFYLCLPENFSPNTDGWVIMGSSNISEAGLGITPSPRYELNVAMKDYDDVAYCKSEFDTLWEQGVPVSKNDIEGTNTHLWQLQTPYEIFMKMLIDAFGNQVEDNYDFSLAMPKGYKRLKYQEDAAIQGFQMLKEHDGFFLADVVGTGKTIVAAMIARRFVVENGRHTHILVVYPPAVAGNWDKTFGDFGLKDYTQFVTNGSLRKVIRGTNNFLTPENFDLVIVDEAHGFRNGTAGRYGDLQQICKAPRNGDRGIPGAKKVMLLSATPLNNRPEDFLNLILLFQDANRPNLRGITNLDTLFAPWKQQYGRLIQNRGTAGAQQNIITNTEQIYDDMRTKVLQQILVRRTRKNLWNNLIYRADLQNQGIHFPQVEQPSEQYYNLNGQLSQLFDYTMKMLTDTPDPTKNPKGTGLHYARYRAIEFITGQKAQKYGSAAQTAQSAQTFAGMFQTHMVKRLESSFYAFKKSLHTFLRITEDMIDMWNNNSILIAPKIDVKGMMAKNMEWDEIVEKALAHGYTLAQISFTQSDFRPDYIKLLQDDAAKLKQLVARWNKVTNDPKFDTFHNLLQTELLQPTITKEGKKIEFNKEGKLVIFSESVDTINYLGDQLKALGRKDVLIVCAANRKKVLNKIEANFDANFKGVKENKYNIIITSDVLAEGVNLHRSNVIVNYDAPWNATRLMQRIGRVNRIGSTSDHIYNYMFYPSQNGNNVINLFASILIKLQGFHTALGEDAQVYSHTEVLREFQLFNANVKDNVDKELELLREVRELYANDRKLYDKIKALPCKSRTVRKEGYRPKELESQSTLVYIRKGNDQQFYRITANQAPIAIPFVEAAELFRAKKNEQPVDNWDSVKAIHYEHVNRVYQQHTQTQQQNATASVAATVVPTSTTPVDKNTATALKFLRAMMRTSQADPLLYSYLQGLEQDVQAGKYSQLTRSLATMSRRRDMIQPLLAKELTDLYNKYHADNHVIVEDDTFSTQQTVEENNSPTKQTEENDNLSTVIVTSETFE